MFSGEINWLVKKKTKIDAEIKRTAFVLIAKRTKRMKEINKLCYL